MPEGHELYDDSAAIASSITTGGSSPDPALPDGFIIPPGDTTPYSMLQLLKGILNNTEQTEISLEVGGDLNVVNSEIEARLGDETSAAELDCNAVSANINSLLRGILCQVTPPVTVPSVGTWCAESDNTYTAFPAQACQNFRFTNRTGSNIEIAHGSNLPFPPYVANATLTITANATWVAGLGTFNWGYTHASGSPLWASDATGTDILTAIEASDPLLVGNVTVTTNYAAGAQAIQADGDTIVIEYLNALAGVAGNSYLATALTDPTVAAVAGTAATPCRAFETLAPGESAAYPCLLDMSEWSWRTVNPFATVSINGIFDNKA